MGNLNRFFIVDLSILKLIYLYFRIYPYVGFQHTDIYENKNHYLRTRESFDDFKIDSAKVILFWRIFDRFQMYFSRFIFIFLC